MDEGATKCDPSDPLVEKGAWILVGDEFTMDSELDEIPEKYKVLELTPTTLKVSLTETWDETGKEHTETYTLKTL